MWPTVVMTSPMDGSVVWGCSGGRDAWRLASRPSPCQGAPPASVLEEQWHQLAVRHQGKEKVGGTDERKDGLGVGAIWRWLGGVGLMRMGVA
jgi:hypothetical protein